MFKKFRTLFMDKHEIEEKAAEKAAPKEETAGKSKKKKFAEKYAASISRLSERTGMSAEEAEACLKEAKKRLNIEPKAYVRYRLYELSEEAQAERWEAIREIEEQRKETERVERNRLQQMVAEETGWSLEEVKEKAKRAKELFDIPLKEYATRGYYALSDEEMQAKHQERLDEIDENNRILHERNVNRLASILGIDAEQAETMLSEASEKRGIPPFIYIKYKFYKIPVENQKEYMSKALHLEEEARQTRLAIRERTISRVVMRTGWSHSKAEQNMMNAYNNYRIMLSLVFFLSAIPFCFFIMMIQL